MKKRIRWLFALLAVCMVISMLPLQAMAAPETYTDEYGVWTYEIEADGSITIVAFQSARKNIVVPAKIGGRPVRKLGDGLFQNRDDLTMIVIPYGITTIGNNVFSGCSKLETVTLPQSLTTIGDGAFANCASLGDLYVPSSVTELGSGVFADSPNINVRCDLNSYTAAYLKDNKAEVASFTLVEVTQKPAVTAPETNDSTATVTIKGQLVTYEFGKTINGKREYTLVLADSMPDMDPNAYLIQHSNGYQKLDEAIYDVLQKRFQLVSLTKYDGTDLTPKEADGLVLGGVWIVSSNDGEHFAYDVQYSLSLGVDDITAGGLGSVEFSSKNELVAYEYFKANPQFSTVKLSSDKYATYTLDNYTSQRYYADGIRAYDKTIRDSYAHKVQVSGSCADIFIHRAVDQDTSATEFNKMVTIYDTKGTTTHRADLWSEQKGNSRSTNVYVETPDSRESSNVYYSVGSSQPDEVHHTEIAPNNDGTYTVKNTHYRAQDSWKGEWQSDGGWKNVYTATEQEVIDHREQIVKAENVSEAEDRTYTQFPNEPSEHTYDVSDKTVWIQGNHTETGTRIDSNGEKSQYTDSHSTTELKDHTYIGSTGKYVGWDWQWTDWNHQEDDNTNSGSNYIVTEYKYSSSDDTWTKTTVHVTPKEDTGATIDDFKRDSASVNLDNYYVHHTDYVFDPSTDSGADNWKEVAQPATTGSDAAAIVLGNTTVTDGSGEVIQQQKAKEEMLELAESLEASAKEDTTKEIFDEAVEEIQQVDPDIAPITAEVEKAHEDNVPVQGNTGDIVEHFHDMNGTVTTEVIPAPETPAEQPAPETPAEQPAPETPAEQPASETTVEQPASETTVEPTAE